VLAEILLVAGLVAATGAPVAAVLGEEQKVTASDGASLDEFGASVAVSGGTALVGAPFDDNDNGVGAGSAYLYARA
jgi:hypothetical protein